MPDFLEDSIRDALNTVFGSARPGLNPRMEFYNKFQREMEEHDWDFKKRYDEDLNTTLIFVSIYSCAGGEAFRITQDPILTVSFGVIWFILSRDIGIHH